MILELTVMALDETIENAWVAELALALGESSGLRVSSFSSARARPGQVVFIDGSTDADLSALDQRLATFDRKGRAVVLILRDGGQMPLALQEGRVDDVIVYPFRSLELWSKIHHSPRLSAWDELSRLNADFGAMISGLSEDLQLAERIQKSRLPARFPDVKGFRIASRYLAGIRSGGDFFDLAESREGSQLSVLLSDSSTYGLSSAVLTVLMRATVRLSSDDARSCVDTVRKIHEELGMILSEKNRLSMFYGVVSRKDYRLRYLNLGDSRAFLSSENGGFKDLPPQGGPITRLGGFSAFGEQQVQLAPGDRLVLLSDGFVESSGGVKPAAELLDRFRSKDAKDVLNELTFGVKSRFRDPDDMPDQDCTAVVIDVDANLVRLAQR